MIPEASRLGNDEAAAGLDPALALSSLVHDLRTPLNHIIGLSEMLIENAEEQDHRGVMEGLNAVREAGIELASLLQDKDQLTLEKSPSGEPWKFSDAIRAPASRILGFTGLVLNEPPTAELQPYLEDLRMIHEAAQSFVSLARNSGLSLMLNAARHIDVRAVSLHPVHTKEAVPNGRVLIVDDEAANREIVSRRLVREGFRPCGVHSGREAIHLLRNELFDVVLLDIQMPEMSGIEVLHIIKSDPQLRHIPVIMLSGLTDVDRVARCIELGAEDYLPKPVNAILLNARLGACLEKKQLRDQEQEHLRAIHAESERLHVTLRSLTDAVVNTDDWGRIILLNDSAARFTSMDIKTVQGLPFSDVFPMSFRANGDPAPNLVGQVLTTRKVAESESELALHLPDGRERFVSIRCSPTFGKDGRLLGTVAVIRDVTDKERMAEEIMRSSKLQSIGLLAGGLAHDYNNLLTAVLGNLSLIRSQEAVPATIEKWLEEAERGAARAQDLTRYLLTFSVGGAPMKKRLQPRNLIEETCAFVLRGSNVECSYQISSELWETEADASQLAQAIGNVVMNAIEATPAGGSIRVCAQNVSYPIFDAPQLPYGDYIRLTVCDDGVGIAEEHLPRIYDPFFTTKKQSRGLGLAAAYSIIQRHDGHISAISPPDTGTTITIYLPAIRSDVVEPQQAGSRGAQPSSSHATSGEQSRRLRVLVMDDEEPIRIMVKAILELAGHTVVGVNDGESALSHHAAAIGEGHPFDLIIMDLTIPGGMGGRETIQLLRKRDPDVPAIVSSGYSTDPVMANYTSCGFNAVLPKPYVMKDLLRVVSSVVA